MIHGLPTKVYRRYSNGLAHSDASAAALTKAGAEVIHGTLDDLDVLRLRGPMSAELWCALDSVEGRFAVLAPLELEEAVLPGDHDQAVPESSGSFTARGRRDHGAEQSRAADAENGRSDIEADLVERLVV